MAGLFNIQVAARAMLDQFGEDAGQEATKRASEAKADNDSELEQSWLQVAKAVADLDSKMPKSP